MKRFYNKISLVSVILLMVQILNSTTIAQDVLHKKNGDSIRVKVSEISSSEIKYKRFDYPDGPAFSIELKSVDSIVFENGMRQFFIISESKSPNLTLDAYTRDDYSQNINYKVLGKEHAEQLYQGRNSGAVWTLITSVLTSPFGGIVTALACSTTQPSFHNLNYPYTSEAQNFEYYRAYVEEAHAQKKKKVWKAFGIGSGVWIFIVLLL
jgi:hypothetical protein